MRKFIVFILSLAVNVTCHIITLIFDVDTTSLKIVGSYAACIISAIVVSRFSFAFYLKTSVFIVFSSSLGSCLNLYHHVETYDLFVHFLSGILLVEFGAIIIKKIAEYTRVELNSIYMNLFAFFFSCSCAAFWEIYEYLSDVLINAQMQGSKANTMGDIIAGVLGAVFFTVFRLIQSKRKHRS